MPTERVTFPGSQGGLLAARLERPDGPARAYALFAHCFTCGKDVFAATRIARELTEHGIAVLRFDFTGLGDSEGDFAETSFSSNIDDLLAAADWLRAEHRAPALLIGHSLGGAAVLAVAGRIAEAKAVAVIGAPADPAHVRHLLVDAAAPDGIPADGLSVDIAGRTFRIGAGFLDDLAEHAQADRIRELRRALLILHAPLDQVVGIDNATAIFRAARHPKSFLSLDRADHLLSDRADASYAAAVIAGWASRYLDAPERQGDRVPVPAEGSVLVAETGRGRFQQSVAIGRHRLWADEPPGVGGGDTGPAPYDFLLAGLGACTSMTIRMYADHKGWPLEAVSVALRHDKIHAKDCAECESASGKVDRIAREISLRGPLSDEQRARLLEIADRCPVHRTLHGEITIPTRLVDPSSPE